MISIWDSEENFLIKELYTFNQSGTTRPTCISWSPNGDYLAIGSLTTIYIENENYDDEIDYIDYDNEEYGDEIDYIIESEQIQASAITIYTTNNWKIYKHNQINNSFIGPQIINWSLDSQTMLSGREIISINGQKIADFSDDYASYPFDAIFSSWSADNKIIALSRYNDIFFIEDEEAILGINFSGIYAWAPVSRMICVVNDYTLYIYKIDQDLIKHDQELIADLQEHSASIKTITFSFDGQFLLSYSIDRELIIWNTTSWKNTKVELPKQYLNIRYHPTKHGFIAQIDDGKSLEFYEIKPSLFTSVSSNQLRYLAAKIVLVGDSGVGKTGLGYQIAHNEYKEHSSTHGQQFWKIDALGVTRDDGTECETVLWDLAGQPDYRLVHSLFLDDTDLALLIFDPTKRDQTLSGVQFWLNQLRGQTNDLCTTILIGARTDRGSATLTIEELERFCEQEGIVGGYISTSAKNEIGLEDLKEQIKTLIPWDRLPTTVTTKTFKRIKDYVLALKESQTATETLVHPDNLRENLETLDEDWQFSDAEMMTAVKHLQTHGYVTILHDSSGQDWILLAPELLANLASSYVLEARRNQHGLGVLNEEQLLAGEYDFPELRKLYPQNQSLLLDATTVLFLEKNICFRVEHSANTYLVFPSLINEKRPQIEEYEDEDDVSYQIMGAIEHVYPSLVVLLGYTNLFVRRNQWQNQAQYTFGQDEICGFRQESTHEGELELILYYAKDTPYHARILFQSLLERFLLRHRLNILRFVPAICSQCQTRLERSVVIKQLDKGKDFSFCHECGEKITLEAAKSLTNIAPEQQRIVEIENEITERRTAFESGLTRLKSVLRDAGRIEDSPTCFMSYAWGISDHEKWVERLAKDMQKAGVDVLLDKWHNG